MPKDYLLYRFQVSEEMIPDITARLLSKITDWKNRPLSEVYPIIYIDVVHFSVRDNPTLKNWLHMSFQALMKKV